MVERVEKKEAKHGPVTMTYTNARMVHHDVTDIAREIEQIAHLLRQRRFDRRDALYLAEQALSRANHARGVMEAEMFNADHESGLLP